MKHHKIHTLTVDELLEIDRWCNVCTGRSPHWDGHTTNPICQGAAREEVVRRARAFDEAKFRGLV